MVLDGIILFQSQTNLSSPPPYPQSFLIPIVPYSHLLLLPIFLTLFLFHNFFHVQGFLCVCVYYLFCLSLSYFPIILDHAICWEGRLPFQQQQQLKLLTKCNFFITFLFIDTVNVMIAGIWLYPNWFICRNSDICFCFCVLKLRCCDKLHLFVLLEYLFCFYSKLMPLFAKLSTNYRNKMST